MKYRAFISYKHAASTGFAENLELAIKAYAKPIWRPPMKVFRDEKYLRPGVNLPSLIRDSLDQSEYLIYLASPEAARSRWVQDELKDWCAREDRLKRLIVILTDGSIVPDPETKRIDWARTDALPETLADKLVFIPLYVDLSWAKRSEQQSLLDPDYKKAINLIVATLRDIDPIQLTGVEVLQHRRNVRIRNAFIASIVTLSVGIAGVAVFAWQQMLKAEWRATYSESLRLADSSPNLAAGVLRQLPANADVEAAPLAWQLINQTPVWTFAEMRGHGDGIWSLAFDATGSRLATGSGDGTVRIRAVDGSAATVVLRGHGALVLDIDFAADGERVVTVAEDDAIRIFDSASGELLREIPVEGSQVNHVAFDPAGNGLMSASYSRLQIHDGAGSATTVDEIPKLIDATWSPDGATLVAVSATPGIGARLYAGDGSSPQTLAGSDEKGAYAASYSPDGSTIAVVCLDGTLRLYANDAPEDDRVLRPDADNGAQAPVVQTADRLVAFSDDGSHVAAAFGGQLHIWPFAGSASRALDHDSAVADFFIGRDGRHAVTLDRSGVVRFWSRGGDDDYASVVLPGHPDVNRVALTRDGMAVVTAAGDGSVRLWNINRSLRPETVLSGHAGPVRFVAFSPDGKTVATASDDRSTRIWRAADGQAVATLQTQPAGKASTVAFSRDGQAIVVAGEQGAFVWPSTGMGDARKLHTGAASAATFHSSGDWLIVASGRGDDARVDVYPAVGNGAPRSFPGRSNLFALAPLDMAAQNLVTFVRQERLATLYRFDRATEPVILRGHDELVLDASFSPDGQYVITGSSDWTARLWDVPTGNEVRRLEGSGTEVEVARFSPDMQRIVTMSSEHMLRFWNLDGQMLRKVQAGGAPGEVAFSADGQKLLIVENGFQGHHLVRVVDMNTDGDPILLTGHDDRIHHAAFSPDGNRVVTAGADGTVRIYPIDWASLRRTLLDRSPVIYEDPE